MILGGGNLVVETKQEQKHSLHRREGLPTSDDAKCQTSGPAYYQPSGNIFDIINYRIIV